MTQPVSHFVRDYSCSWKWFEKHSILNLLKLWPLCCCALSGRAMLAIPEPNRRPGTAKARRSGRFPMLKHLVATTNKSGRAI